MVSENKRFQYNVNKNCVEDKGMHFAYCNGEQTKIVRKLNELDEEWIKELNLRETFQLELQRVEEKNKTLKAENEQLKQELHFLRQKETVQKLNDMEHSTFEQYLKKQNLKR